MIFNINEINKTIPALIKISWRISVKKKPGGFKIVKSDNKKRRKITKTIFGNYELNKNSARVLLALLYWSSGAKYPASNFVAFSNSDSDLVKTFLNLLRLTFNISEPRIKIHLQLYSTQDGKKMTEFWSKLLGVPQRQFYKPSIFNPPKRHVRPDYFGTCTVRYHSLDLLLTLTELWNELSKTI